jgi:MFS transporter, Spinster family, sphingosine-1-phosphate transporter
MLTRAESRPLRTGSTLLFVLTFVNLLNYLDRYILVALSPAIKEELHLSDTRIGLLTTAFMVSYFLVSPLFGWLGDRFHRLRLMGFGVAVWSVATAVSGLGRSARDLLAARLFVGVGEAAYGSISPSILRDLFPKEKSGRVFAIFFMAIPVGSALGYLLGGVLEKWLGWRHAFYVAGVPGLLLALLLFFLPEPQRGAFDDAAATEAEPSGREVFSALWGNNAYFLTVLGYCAYTFALGGIAVWIPHYIQRYLGVPAATGNMVFGGITVVGGLIGTLVGGGWADRWSRRAPDGYLKVSALSMFLALPVYVLVLRVHNFTVFCAAVFVLEFLLFLSTSPINAEIVNAVSPRMRAMASAVAIFSIHLFGDVISPPLVGVISDHSSLLRGMCLFILAILLSALIWAWKVLAAWEVLAWPEGALKLPKSQCHRGFHPAGVQENTLAAFRAAAVAGAQMVELDVRVSSDGLAVVMHDADIARVSGRTGLVHELTAKQLKEMANAPLLREVLDDPACSGLFVNVELKREDRRTLGLEKAVAEAVRGREGRVLFSSFNPLALREMAKLCPDVPRALLATGENHPSNKFYLRKMLLAFLARPHMLNYDGRYFTPGLARSLAARKVPVAIWTVEEPAEAKKFLALGAESIISPKPDIITGLP